MSTFTTTLSSIKEGKQILNSIYYSHNDAVFITDKNAVYAHCLTATLTKNKNYFLITLSSNFYFESTLKEIVQSALQLN